MSNIVKTGSAPVTMTSLEIVDFINDLRKEDALKAGAAFPSPGFAKLEHSDFTKKVPEVLGERAGNFSATYQIPGPNGSSRAAPCYRFPKREASLMAMSYSYKIQARVWDHMTALEEKLIAKEAAALAQPAKSNSTKDGNQTGLPEFRRARALDLATRTAERIVSQFPSLCEQSRQVVFAKVINPVAGMEILALPHVENKTYPAEKVGEMLGITANMVGRIANSHGLKKEEFGMFLLDKSRHSSKQVQTFVYNDAGVEAIKQRLDAHKPDQPVTRKGPRFGPSPQNSDARH